MEVATLFALANAALLLLGFEIWAAVNKTKGDTITERSRLRFKTDTIAGRGAFATLMFLLILGLIVTTTHILWSVPF